ncbi:MAG TPA: response regulator [Planctomycetota bacterium]|nr:response regulator [Planctomycetota bacterium]
MRILVAEDEAISQRLLVRVLSSMGHEPVATSDGEEAWRAYVKQPFPVVVTDWLMPGTDGLELTRRIREQRARVYPWIIMLTAMDYGSHFRRTMEAGVDDFLTKPVDHELLRVRLTVAERVQHMSEQVRMLASALPICMHCKAVRDTAGDWTRLETFFHDVDFSHGYCPDCYYGHSLLPELQRVRATLPAGAAAALEADAALTLDPAVLGPLLAAGDRDSPGLFDELVDGLRVAQTTLRPALQDYAAGNSLSTGAAEKLGRLRRRCGDLGLGRLGALIDRLQLLPPEEQLAAHAELGPALVAALDAALGALAEAQAQRAAGLVAKTH